MPVAIKNPPNLMGTPDQKLMQIYDFLFILSRDLNVALAETENEAVSAAADLIAAGGNPSQMAPQNDSYDELRSLIINTADVINIEMDVIREEMNSQYTAISEDFGIYQETINKVVEETAKSTAENYTKIEEITGSLEDYKAITRGYIRKGFITDPDGKEVFGIAIGTGLPEGDGDADGNVDLNDVEYCAFYTANRLSFRAAKKEVAWFSNDELYTNRLKVGGSVTLDNWLITNTSGSITVKWIGGVVGG